MSCTSMEKTTEVSLNAERKYLQQSILDMSICLIYLLIISTSLESEIYNRNKLYSPSQNLFKQTSRTLSVLEDEFFSAKD